MNKTLLFFLGAVAVGYFAAEQVSQIPGVGMAGNIGYNLGYSGKISVS
jgi:hypothetical protein